MSIARDRLLRLRSAVEADAAELESSLADVRAARSDGSADDEHDPEGSTLTSDWSHMQGLSSALKAQLDDIDQALGRLDAGSYGRCIRCGDPVGEARLEVRPAARHCIECAQRLERR